MDSAIHLPLLRFWQANARPGYVGLIGIRFPLARLIGKSQAPLTPDGTPSLWAHAFIFQKGHDDIPWIYESDIGFPRRGIFHWMPQAQENPVTKWSTTRITQACVLEAGLDEGQVEAALVRAQQLISQGIRYRVRDLLATWLAIRRGKLEKENFLHSHDGLHCGAFVRTCLAAAGGDSVGDEIAVCNTVPEVLYQRLCLVARWE